MSTQHLSITTSSFIALRPLLGCLTTGPVPALPVSSLPQVTALVPMLLDTSTSGGRRVTESVDFILSGSSNTPTGGVALLAGSTALYLLFNLLDLPTRQMLALAQRMGRLNVHFDNALLPFDSSKFEALTSFRKATHHDTDPHEWFQHAHGLASMLPGLCAERAPAFLAAKTHNAVFLSQIDALVALSAWCSAAGLTRSTKQ